MLISKRMTKNKEGRYQEGECESCSNYARLYEVGSQLLCEECRDEEGAISDKESKTETDEE